MGASARGGAVACTDRGYLSKGQSEQDPGISAGVLFGEEKEECGKQLAGEQHPMKLVAEAVLVVAARLISTRQTPPAAASERPVIHLEGHRFAPIRPAQMGRSVVSGLGVALRAMFVNPRTTLPPVRCRVKGIVTDFTDPSIGAMQDQGTGQACRGGMAEPCYPARVRAMPRWRAKKAATRSRYSSRATKRAAACATPSSTHTSRGPDSAPASS